MREKELVMAPHDTMLISVRLSVVAILCAMLPPADKNKQLIYVETKQTKIDLSEFKGQAQNTCFTAKV